MVVDIEMQTDAVLVTPVGDVDILTAPELGEALRTAVDAGMRTVVVDLSRVPFMDSAGLGALIGGIRRAREAGGDVAVACSRPTLTRLLHTTGFDRIVPVTETVEAAASALATADESG